MATRIGIAGCGIAGLTAAILLRAQGHAVTLFDRFSTPSPVGSGLVIQPVGQAVLHRCGVLDKALQKGQRIDRMIGHDADVQTPILDVSYDPKKGKRFGLAIHRSTLFNALYEKAIEAGAHYVGNAAVIDIQDDYDTASIKLNHDMSETFDLVVNATGSGSSLTPLVSKPLSYGAIWGTVPWPKNTRLDQKELRQMYRAAANMVGVLPLKQVQGSDGFHAAIFWSLTKQGYDNWLKAPIEDWKEQASTLWQAFLPFLATITDHSQMTFAQYSHGTLRKPYGQRCVHLGDAAHRASPQLGQGANMALLDAFALAEALQEYPIHQAAGVWAQSRKIHTMVYQSASWAFTPMYQSNSRILPWLRNYVLAKPSQLPVSQRLLSRLVCGDLVNPVLSSELLPRQTIR